MTPESTRAAADLLTRPGQAGTRLDQLPEARNEGKGAAALGDPRVALTWIVNELRALGVAMPAGKVVTTGTCLTPVPVVPGDEVRASYGEFGELSVRMS